MHPRGPLDRVRASLSLTTGETGVARMGARMCERDLLYRL